MSKLIFNNELEKQYIKLFKSDPEFAWVKSRMTPKQLADKMTLSFEAGNANKDGTGIKNTCKALGIIYTYKAIESFIKS